MDNEAFGREIGDNNADLIKKCHALKDKGLPSEETRVRIRELFKAHQTRQGEILRKYLESI